jgi:NADH-quinone oxidoreductase subunit L
VVTIPLVLLAIPSIFAGYYIGTVGLGYFFGDSIIMGEQYKILATNMPAELHILHNTDQVLREDYHGIGSFILHGLMGAPFWLMLAGIGSAWYLYLKNDNALDWLNSKLKAPRKVLENQYYFDAFNQGFFAKGALYLGNSFAALIERLIIEVTIIGSITRSISWLAGRARLIQTGYLYHAAFAMVLGILAMATWFIILLW